MTPEGSYLVITRFDSDNPKQRQRVLHLVSHFVAWMLATSFVLTAETWIGTEPARDEAILVVGVSRQERISLLQRIEERDPLVLGPPEWLTADQIDEAYIDLLPSKTRVTLLEEIADLTAIFGKGGEMEAERLS